MWAFENEIPITDNRRFHPNTISMGDAQTNHQLSSLDVEHCSQVLREFNDTRRMPNYKFIRYYKET